MTDLIVPNSSASPSGPSAPRVSAEPSSEFTPAAITQRRFGTAFRGLDPDEVRTYLQRLSSHLKGLHEQISGLTVELDAARSAKVVVDLTSGRADTALTDHKDADDVDPEAIEAKRTVDEVLGEAHREAKSIVDRANDEAARILLRARAESRGKQPDGSRVIGDPASAVSVSAVSVGGTGPSGVAALAAGTGEAVFDVPDDPDAARAQARAMIQEARAVRERILTDLGKRRRTAHVQLEQLRVAREKLQETLREARRVIDASSKDVSHAEVEARLAAESAGRRVAAEPMPTVEQLEIEVMGGRHMSLFRPSDQPDQSDQPDGDLTAVELTETERTEPELSQPESDSSRVDTASEANEIADTESAEAAAVVEEVAVNAEMVEAEPVVSESVVPEPEPVEPELVESELAESEAAEALLAESVVAEVAATPDPMPDPNPDPALSTTELTGRAEQAEQAERTSATTPISKGVSKSASKKGPAKKAPKKKAADDVFARLRAERVQTNEGTSALAPQLEVSSLEEIAEADAELDAHASTDSGLDSGLDTPTLDATAAHETASREEPSSDSDTTILERRNHDMELLQLRVSKQLKRHLQDEHSAALSSVRRSRGKLTADSLLDPVETQHGRLIAVMLPALTESTQAGMRAVDSFGFAATSESPSVDDLAEAMASDLLDPIRNTLQTALDDQSTDIPGVLGQAFRDWNTDRLGRRVRDALSAAFAKGLVTAVPLGTEMHWLVDHGDEPSPECDDNALAGTVPRGEAFPTGHTFPPLGPGCRCLVVPRH